MRGSLTLMASGYSGTPLAAKLGIKPGDHVLLIDAPEGFESKLEGLPPTAVVSRNQDHIDLWDVVILFATERERVGSTVDFAKTRMQRAGSWWIAWPKKASGVPTDIVEQSLRDLLLSTTTLVDNKVCAIDDIWSGLRFVRRRNSR